MSHSVAAIESTAVRPQISLGIASCTMMSMLMLLLSLSFGAGQVRAQCGSLTAPSTTWQNGGNSYWNLDGNWTSGTPTASTNACILNGVSTVTLNTTGSVNGLQIAFGNHMNIDGTGSLSLFGTLSNSGLFANAGNINSPQDPMGGFGGISNSGIFSNSGTINTGGIVNDGLFLNSGTLNPGGTLSDFAGSLTNNGVLQNTGSIFLNEDSVINNYGTMNNTKLIATGPFTEFINFGTLNNNGVIDIFSGSVLGNAGTLNNKGVITADLGNSGTINNTGTYTALGGTNTGIINNSGAFNAGGINSAIINNTNTGTLTYVFGENDGVISNSGIFNNTGTPDTFPLLNVGTILNNGTLNNVSGAVFTNAGTMVNSGVFNNMGSFSNTGTINSPQQQFQILGGIINSGTFSDDGLINTQGLTNNGLIVNAGTINSGGMFSGGAGFLTNYGTIANTGTILQDENGVFTNYGVINNNNLIVAGPFSNFINYNIINNNRTILITPFSFLSNSGTITNNGMIGGSGFFLNGGILNNAGALGDNLSPLVLHNVGTINNFGTANVSGFINTGTVTDVGIFNIESAGGPFATNSGIVTVSTSGLLTTNDNYVQSAGSTVVNGTMTANSGSLIDIEGGMLGGTGTINGDVLLKGLMSPGSNGVPGTLTIEGNYEQSGTGLFEELISGANSNGVLDVSGVLSLDPGSLLEITLQGGFDPLGDSFTILNFGSLLGEFSNAPIFFADGFEWTVTYGSNDAVLTAVGVPEPNTMPLIAIGFLALIGFASKKTAEL